MVDHDKIPQEQKTAKRALQRYENRSTKDLHSSLSRGTRSQMMLKKIAGVQNND